MLLGEIHVRYSRNFLDSNHHMLTFILVPMSLESLLLCSNVSRQPQPGKSSMLVSLWCRTFRTALMPAGTSTDLNFNGGSMSIKSRITLSSVTSRGLRLAVLLPPLGDLF